MGCSPVNAIQPNEIVINQPQIIEIKAEKQEDFSEYDLLLGHQIDNLSIKTEIFLSCKKLTKLTSYQNSFITVYRNEGNRWIEIGKTEICKNSPNPYFIKSFAMNYRFAEDENNQQLKFQVDYIDKVSKITPVGNVIVTLKDILTSATQELEKQFEDKRGKLVIKGIQKPTNSKYIQFRLGIKGKKLTKNKIMCKIMKKKVNAEYIPIYITEEKDHITSKKDRCFYWDIVEFEQSRLENKGGHKLEETNDIKFQIFEVGKNDKPKLITEVEIVVNELKKREHQLKQVKNDFHFLLIEEEKLIDKFTLFSFLVSGMEYQSFFFFDLTRSNYNYGKSIYLNNPFTKNIIMNPSEDLIYRPYKDMKNKDKEKYAYLDVVKEQMMKDEYSDDIINQKIKENKRIRDKAPLVGLEKKIEVKVDEMQNLMNSIVKDQFELDSDNKAACFGFGCNLPPDCDIMCNCVAMTLDIMSPEINGYQGVLEAYNRCMGSAYLSGPPLVSDTLSLFFNYVKGNEWTKDTQMYSVGIFISSGGIHDSTVLFNQLSANSLLPCSVVVISLGKEFNAEEFQKEVDLYKETLGDKRLNLIYIDFHEISVIGDDGKDIIDKTALACKLLYNRINEQFVDFINIVDAKPFDHEKIESKSTPDFFEFRKKKKNEKYFTPKILINEKERLLTEIQTLKYNQVEFESTFNNSIPTFDRHFIINQLNKTKIKILNKTNQRLIKPKILQKEADYILYNQGLVIDERYLITDQKNIELTKQKEEEERKSKEAKEKTNNYSKTICNLCNQNPINIVFQDCKHRFCCVYCIMNLTDEKCPICLKKISLYVRQYNI